MAKGARASTIKSNNSKLKNRVFGPVETARTERLSAKLLELASQPRPQKTEDDAQMEVEGVAAVEKNEVEPVVAKTKDEQAMEVDGESKVSKPSSKGRIEKKRSGRHAAIVFPKYKKGKKTGPKPKKQKIY
ncbi:hypothetical protein PVAG01_02445 [Phlyctema vagabunda]|uniref:DUF2423 domain-containing protein n=1 Tax=Phlyctema vagabunda TaxID=108571 RepID=A0ABR4PQK7_9HELO